MDRLSLPAAVLTVAAIFVVFPAAALADTSADAAASEAVVAADTALAEPAPAAAEPAATVDAPAVEPAAEPVAEPPPAEPAAAEPAATTPTESTPATGTAPAAATEGAAAPDPAPATPVTAAEEGDTSFVVVVHTDSSAASAEAPRHGTTPSPAPAPPITSLSGGEVMTAPLESVLPKVKRELREVEAQINDLRRRIDNGEPAPALSIIRLSLTLAEIVPAIMALDGRLDAAGLTPGLEREVRRLREQLADTQASAAGLLLDMRRSDAYGFEVQTLMRELQSFSALELVTLAPSPGLAPAREPSAVEVPPPPAHAAAPAFTHAVADEPGPASSAGAGPAVGSPDRVGSDGPLDRSLGSSSGSASPGGAFSAAGVAALAVLLIGLAASRLSAALSVAPRRRYSVMFLSPLERPG